MEHSYDIGSPWRARAFLAAAIAALELVVILVIAVVLVARPLSHHLQRVAARKAVAPKHTTAAKVAAPPHVLLSRGETKVMILNGNGRTGAAGSEADQVRNLGYLVPDVGNASRIGYTRTLVMYRPGYAAEGQRLAHDAGIGLVGPLDGMRPAQLKGAHTVIVVGSNS